MSQEGFKRIIECVEFLKQTLNVVLKFKPVAVLDLIEQKFISFEPVFLTDLPTCVLI